MAPTLNERKAILDTEIETVRDLQTLVEEKSVDGCKSLCEIDNMVKMKDALLITISHLSSRVRELRELVVKKQIALTNLLNQIEGDWKNSKLASAISFYKTKIIHSGTAISDLLHCVDNLAYTVACINGTENDYVRGMHTKVYFDQQSNYICLKDATPTLTITDPNFIKQRTEAWHDLRNGSRLTGSTIFKGIGLGLLKEQQEHYDKVFKGKQPTVTPELQELFDYGTKQEINALATLLGKIVPVYYPNLKFQEDGCDKIPLGESYVVVSGDGSGVDGKKNVEVAFEFKCPRPGKTRTTDVHYTLPVYYTTQILSQMVAKKCDTFGYICYSTDSATYIAGKQNRCLWNEIFQISNDLYGAVDAQRPKRNQPYQRELLDKLKDYGKTCELIGEFQPLIGIQCSCRPTDDHLDMHGCHFNHSNVDSNRQSLETVAAMIQSSGSALKVAYEILRRPAKEILVSVISDLDRTITSNDMSFHAVPVHYALSGYSLPMLPVRCILKELLNEITNMNMHLRVIAFDGLFLELAVAEESGRPLTVCRFMKYFWMMVQKMEKANKLTALLQTNNVPSIQNHDDLTRHFNVNKEGHILQISSKSGMNTVSSPGNIAKAISKYISKRDKKDKHSVMQDDESTEDLGRPSNDLDIIAYLPQDIIDNLDDEILLLLRNTKERVLGPDIPVEVQDDQNTIHDAHRAQSSGSTDFEVLLITLIASTEDPNSKWGTISLEDFQCLFSDAATIQKTFVVSELKAIASVTQAKHVYTKLLKPQLVNLVSSLHGDGSTMDRKQTPKSLKILTTNAVKKWNIDGINVAYAQLCFPDALIEWENDNEFVGEWTIEADDGTTYTIPRWYAQPAHIDGQSVQTIIDPHHIFVNNRARCCSKGMAGMRVNSKAWWNVAEESAVNGTGLSMEIAKELRDRQRNSFAHITFSEKVEDAMEKNGDLHEAQWCHLIRNWYRSIDEAAVDINQRVEWMFEIRNYLLSFLNVGHFPPPGGFVAGLPMAQYEGILTNVDRRLQLYSMTSQGAHNQRAVTSLDSETFFSAFQDYDPKGTGILRPDDIPTAIGAAVSLFNQRMDSTRRYYMKTHKKQRVYPQHTLTPPAQRDEAVKVADLRPNHIILRPHHFDTPGRLSKTPRRKSDKISAFGAPSRGAEGVRAYHRLNEENILPHKRFGLTDKDVDP